MAYPQITDDKFQEKIYKKYKKFIIPEKKPSFKQICFPEDYKLQIPQEFLSNFINPDTHYKSIIIYHRIGAGKTCTAIRIAEEWKHKRKIVVVLPASLKRNFQIEIISRCTGNAYLSTKERDILSKLHPQDKEYQRIQNKALKEVDKYYNIYSYNKFIELANKNQISLTNSILIIDEIQNMVSEDGTYYNSLYDLIQDSPNSLRTILLSATPMFDKPVEIALTMNLLRIPTELPTGNDFIKQYIDIKYKDGKPIMNVKNMDDFKRKIAGYISFYRGAPDYVYPEMKIKYLKCEMSAFQYQAYQEAGGDEDFKKSTSMLDISNLPSNFFIGTRYVSNIVFPNKKINDKGFKSLEKINTRKTIGKYSCKFEKILQKVNSASGKVFIYSGFKEYGGIKSLVKVLEDFGYKNYKEHGEGSKRFALWSGDEKDNYKDEIRSVYNLSKNLNGSKIKIILGSPSIKEGVSFYGVRQVHILEPYWNVQRLNQVIGRASRFCSHKDLPEEKRNVKVFVYLATHPKIKESVDEYIYKLSKQKNKIIDEFEKSIKEASIDCMLFRNANGKDIECGI